MFIWLLAQSLAHVNCTVNVSYSLIIFPLQKYPSTTVLQAEVWGEGGGEWPCPYGAYSLAFIILSEVDSVERTFDYVEVKAMLEKLLTKKFK